MIVSGLTGMSRHAIVQKFLDLELYIFIEDLLLFFETNYQI